MLFTLSVIGLKAQQNGTLGNKDIDVGTILKIGKPYSYDYRHIHFPRKNFIIKRGSIANLKSV